MRRNGLSARIILAMLGLTIGVLVISFFGLRQAASNDLAQRLDASLKSEYRALKVTTLDPAGTQRQIKEGMQGFLDKQPTGIGNRAYFFKFDDGSLLTNGQQFAGALVGSRQPKEGLSTVSLGKLGDFRLYTKPLRRSGKIVATCVVAASLDVVTDAQHGLDQAFLSVALITLLLAALISFLIARQIASPVRKLTDSVASSDHVVLAHPVEYEGSIREFSKLAESYNTMVARIDDGLSRERAFVADASHELRTPLAVLRGQLELLLHKSDMNEGEREHTVQLLLGEVDLMSRLIEDMLVLARLDGDGALDLQEVNIVDFARDLERDLPLFGAREYSLKLEADGQFVLDPDRINRVLRNLVTNSVAHTGPEGRIEIEIERAGDGLGLAVSDDGVGIPRDQLEAIFGRFNRGTLSGAEGEGSGLGLAIVRAIVDAHGGKVWAEARPGGGSVFRIILPAAAQGEDIR